MIRRTAAILTIIALAIAGCGSSDDEADSTAGAPDASTVSGEAESALEGTWRTEPVTVADMAAVLREAGLGASVGEFGQNAPISDAPTELILDVGDDWDLYGQAQGEPRAKIDYDARFEVTGDTVVVTHGTGTSNTFRWSVSDEVLELTWLEGTAPPYKGIPDEAFQRALYMTAAFQRADSNDDAEDTTTTAQTSGEIDGEFDVGGHSLYLKCRGTEAPAIVYMHGSIDEASAVPHSNGESFLNSLGNDHRVCVYDRRNLGRSETVDAPQLPEDALGDMHELLNDAGVEPPYVLLGASFGGLLSYLYANTYPDEVAGMVLLDSPFPDQLSLEHLVKPADRYKAFDAEDENESLERISHYKALEAGQRYIGREPAIPVTFLSSIPESDAVLGIPEYDRKALRLQEAYVERFSPGRYLRVDAPHFMEVAIPDEITRELRRVIQLSERTG